MRPHVEEVIDGLRVYAVGQSHAIRANQLAPKINLSPKIVSNALHWLAVEKKHPGVKRAKHPTAFWYRYWWDGP